MIEVVSETGGHLGAGLGVVELTVALHYLFNTPKYESQMSNRNQELLMVFGITFAMSFFMRSVSSKGGDSINYSSNIPPGEVLLSQSTRPPF